MKVTPQPHVQALHPRHLISGVVSRLGARPCLQNKFYSQSGIYSFSFSCAPREGTADVSATMATCPGPVTRSGSCGPLLDSEAAAGSGGLCLVHLLSIQSDEPWVDPERTTHIDTQFAVCFFLFLRYLSVRHLPPAQWDVFKLHFLIFLNTISHSFHLQI